MFNFMKKKTAVNGKDYKRMYRQKCEEYESLAKDYNVVVANLQDLVSNRKELLAELEDERYRHDRYADYAREQDEQLDSLRAQLKQLRAFLATTTGAVPDVLGAHTPTQEEIDSVFGEESV